MKSLLCFIIHAEKANFFVNIVVLKENLEPKWWNSVIELMLMMELGFLRVLLLQVEKMCACPNGM